MSARDWALMVLAAADGKPVGQIHMQKILYLLGKQRRDLVGRDFYSFQHYNYGAYASSLRGHVETHVENGLAAAVQVDGVAHHAITQDGAKVASILPAVPAEGRAYVKALVAAAMCLSWNQLVELVYAQYPDTRANSVFQSQSVRPDTTASWPITDDDRRFVDDLYAIGRKHGDDWSANREAGLEELRSL